MLGVSTQAECVQWKEFVWCDLTLIPLKKKSLLYKRQVNTAASAAVCCLFDHKFPVASTVFTLLSLFRCIIISPLSLQSSVYILTYLSWVREAHDVLKVLSFVLFFMHPVTDISILNSIYIFRMHIQIHVKSIHVHTLTLTQTNLHSVFLYHSNRNYWSSVGADTYVVFPLCQNEWACNTLYLDRERDKEMLKESKTKGTRTLK